MSRVLSITTQEHDRLMGEVRHEYEKKLDALRVKIHELESALAQHEAPASAPVVDASKTDGVQPDPPRKGPPSSPTKTQPQPKR